MKMLLKLHILDRKHDMIHIYFVALDLIFGC